MELDEAISGELAVVGKIDREYGTKLIRFYKRRIGGQECFLFIAAMTQL